MRGNNRNDAPSSRSPRLCRPALVHRATPLGLTTSRPCQRLSISFCFRRHQSVIQRCFLARSRRAETCQAIRGVLLISRSGVTKAWASPTLIFCKDFLGTSSSNLFWCCLRMPRLIDDCFRNLRRYNAKLLQVQAVVRLAWAALAASVHWYGWHRRVASS